MPPQDTTFKDHFSALSTGYSKFRPSYSRDLFQYLSSLPSAQNLAWDCATGTGQAAVALADLFARVIATDASAEQIKQAYHHPSIEYRVAKAEDSVLAAASVDLITVAQALHWFDIPRFMQEAQRVLRPGGVIAVWTYNLFRITPEIDAVVDDLYWNILHGYWAAERKMVDNAYADMDMPFRELSPPQFKMRASWPLRRVIGYLGTWSAIRNYQETQGVDPMVDIAARLQLVWGEAAEEKEISWPLSLRVGVHE